MSQKLKNVQKRIGELIRQKQSDLLIESPMSLERTLSYTEPLIDANPPSRKGVPQVLVMAPTLASVERVAGLFDKKRLKSAVTLRAVGGTDLTANTNQLRQGCDYLIGTPGRLSAMHKNSALVTSSLSAVVLEEADTLLSSELVLTFMRSAISETCQRVFVSEKVSDWYNDTLQDLIRTGCALERVSLTPQIYSIPPGLVHQYIRKSGEGSDVRQLKLIVESRQSKSIIFCKNDSDVFRLVSEPLLGDFIAVSSDMSEKVKAQQLAKFRSNPSAVLVTSEQSVDSITVDLIVNFGAPTDMAQYASRANLASPKGRMVTIFRQREADVFSKLRAKSGLLFTPIKSDADERNKLLIAFAQALLKQPVGDTIPSWIAKEGSDIRKLHGPEGMASLVSMAEARKSVLDKRSPLSGMTGYIPVLLFDPFLKKVRNYEQAEKLIKGCFRTIDRTENGNVELGRIALSAKGFVVDVPSGQVSDVVDNKRLKQRNIKAICVSELPPLVQSDRLFMLKQSWRDKKRACRLVAKKRASR